jgi:hypothetical protein
LITPLCPSPPAAETAVATSGVALAVKLAGELAPLTLAVAVCEPEVVPSVQVVLAWPLASVVPGVGSRLPPDVVAQVTVVPALAAPASVTVTVSGPASGCPTTPAWPSPAVLEIVIVEGGVPLSPPQPERSIPSTTAAAWT